MFLLITLLLVIGVLSLLVFFSRKKLPRNHYLNKLPGPPPNLFFGNTLEFIGPTSIVLKKLLKWNKEYSPIWKLHDGTFSSVVVVAEEDFLEYVLSSSKLVNKSPQYDYFHGWLGTGLLTSTASKHKRRRKLLTPAFHFSILENFLGVFDSVSDVFIKKLEEFVGKPSLNIYPLVSLCTLDIICEATMGTKINALSNETSKYVNSVKTICSIINDRNFSPFSPKIYPFTINYQREKAALKTLHSHSDDIIDKRFESRKSEKDQNKNFQKGSKDDNSDLGVKPRLAFLDLLIQAAEDGADLSRKDIREEVDTFMFEGHDTTSSALSFCLYSLSIHPEVQEKVLNEQKEIFKNRHMKAAKPTLADISSMKYLELVIKETLRIYPSVPFFGRTVAEEFEYDGVLYPKGTVLGVFSMAVHRNPKYFPDPDKFVPERFANIDEKNPYVYIPFSAGVRNCIGQKFAMLELKSTISKVVRNFELLPASPRHELELAAEIILISKNGINVALQGRDYDE